MQHPMPDFINNVPHPIPANSVPFWDGCSWTLVQMPAAGMTCPEVVICMQPTVTAIWAEIATKITCADLP